MIMIVDSTNFLQVSIKSVICKSNMEKNWIDKDKLQAIQEWRGPTYVTKLCTFLGLINYYHWFIKEFLRRIAPLIELLKKGTTLK